MTHYAHTNLVHSFVPVRDYSNQCMHTHICIITEKRHLMPCMNERASSNYNWTQLGAKVYFSKKIEFLLKKFYYRKKTKAFVVCLKTNEQDVKFVLFLHQLHECEPLLKAVIGVRYWQFRTQIQNNWVRQHTLSSFCVAN